MTNLKADKSGEPIAVRARRELGELKKLLKKVEDATCQINLVKSRRAPVLKNTRKLETTKSLSDHFKEQLVSELDIIVADALSGHDGLGEFNFKAFADGKIAAFPVTKFVEIKEWLGKIPPDDSISAFSPSDMHASQLRFTHTAITFDSDGKKIRIFCKSGNAKLASRKLLARLLTGDRYDYVEPNKSVVLDSGVDFFLWDNLIFISNYKKFESILNFRDITRSVAESVLKEVLKVVPVTHSVELQDKLFSGARNLNKLASLKGQKHLPKLNMDVIGEVIRERNLPVKVITLDGIKTIEIDPEDPSHVKAYLEILGDDIVRSLLTGIDYISGEKIAVS